MGKLIITTLAGLYIVLVVAGRDVPSAAGQAQADPAPQLAQAEAAPVAVAPHDPTKIVAKAASTPQIENAALITPVIPRTRMPGPRLKPAPETRPIETPAKSDGASLWKVTASALNVRSGPSTSDRTVDSIRRGEEVLLVSESGGWAHVRIEGDGVDGWVSKRYLTPSN